MKQIDLLNRAFLDPQIRENRITIIASQFSKILLSRYHNKLKSIDVQIKCARNKEELEEVLRLTEDSMKNKMEFLKSQGVNTIMDGVWSYFYVPDVNSEDYYYSFTDRTEEQKKAISVIYDYFRYLEEDAIRIINRREQIRIDCSNNIEDRVYSLRRAHEKPYSEYTCEILLNLIQTDQFGSPVSDDLGFERSVDPWYAAAVINSSFFRTQFISHKAFESIYERLLYEKSFGYYKSTFDKERDQETISLIKLNLANLASTFPWINQLIPGEGGASYNKLIEDNLHLVAFFSGFRQTPLLSDWFQYVYAGETPYLRFEVIFNKDGCLNLDYIKESVLPKVKQLKTRISNIPIDEDRDNQLCRCLLENATSDTSYIVIFSDILKALGIPHLYPSKCWELFISSRLKCGEHIIIDKVIDSIYKTLTGIVEKNEFDYGFFGSTITNNDLIKELEELFIILDDATTTYEIDPKTYYQDLFVFLRTNCASHLSWYPDAREHGYDTRGGEKYYFSVWNTYQEDNLPTKFDIADGLVQKDLEVAIESGYKPKPEDLVVETVINEEGHFNYRLMFKNNSKRYLFFDTETTGLPKNYQAPCSDTNNWPRLVQLSWIITDEKGAKIKEVNRIIKPSGFIIPKSSEELHGISTNRALLVGKNLNEVLDEFTDDLNSSIIVIGHNVEFDKRIIGAEFIRSGRKDIITPKSAICTMKTSAEFCKILGGNGSYRYPKLVELHKKLFGVGFDDAHNASSDVVATEKCFWELVRKGLIDLNKPQKDIEQHPSSRNIDEEDKCLPF